MIERSVAIKLNDATLLQADGYLGGQWIPADSGARFDVSDPSNGARLARVADMGTEETRRAIAAAAAALPDWRARTAKERSAILFRWYQLMMDHADDLGLIVTLEMGKPLAEGRGEVIFGAKYVEWFAEEAKRAYGEVIPTHDSTMRLMVIKQPVGVVGAITPWNFPSSTMARKVAPALAAGCTVVAKPAQDTPLSSLALAVLAERAGVPAGAFNVIPALDPVPVGEELTINPAVRKISFTGSTPVGKTLMAQGARTVTRMGLELGGNAPLIILDDADLNAAVPEAVVAKYRNGGQTCICANRLLVQDGIYDEFVRRFTAAAARLTVGPGIIGRPDVGPLINEAALRKVEGLVQDALSRGASLLLGGAAHPRGRTFYRPTVLVDVTPDMPVAIEEVFGPVATIFRFDTDEEAIAVANNTPFGLAAYVFARNSARVWRMAEGLDYGMVGVNTGLLMTEVAPFGGIKESGFGREGARQGLEEFLETKYIAVGGIGA